MFIPAMPWPPLWMMCKDNTAILEDGEMHEIDLELEESKRFCLMIKPLKNRPKVAVQVNLKDLALRKLSYEHNSYNFSGVICTFRFSDEELDPFYKTPKLL